jgi:hypothetical protein
MDSIKPPTCHKSQGQLVYHHETITHFTELQAVSSPDYTTFLTINFFFEHRRQKTLDMSFDGLPLIEQRIYYFGSYLS